MAQRAGHFSLLNLDKYFSLCGQSWSYPHLSQLQDPPLQDPPQYPPVEQMVLQWPSLHMNKLLWMPLSPEKQFKMVDSTIQILRKFTVGIGLFWTNPLAALMGDNVKIDTNPLTMIYSTIIHIVCR